MVCKSVGYGMFDMIVCIVCMVCLATMMGMQYVLSKVLLSLGYCMYLRCGYYISDLGYIRYL